MRSLSIPKVILSYIDGSKSNEELISASAKSYKILNNGNPEISIVIPAYNEEANIVSTLTSLCNNKTAHILEIIVVNNNSTDDTERLVRAFGVSCINEIKQGITNARNAGLASASGTYILNADADTIYPPDWVEQMVKPLMDPKNSITYGRFSLIPTGSAKRSIYFVYEYFTEITRWIESKTKDEAVNVYGFNSGFRREQGLSVGGFNHPEGTNEDGHLAFKLRNKGFGKLFRVTAPSALVWTTDRRIQIDGGLVKASVKRLKRLLRMK